tara:strand:- start:759 stop:1238 length:480 start_codon:yes stop_codon:yes gene_type:complete
MHEIEAIAVLTNVTDKKINGHIIFKEDLKNKCTKIIIRVKGLPPGKHGFHIHKAGDLRNSCTSLCDHFNPTNKKHGDIKDKERHIGDLGNIIADKNGNCSTTIKDKLIKLKGKYSIIGRSVVIHEDEDDLGRGNHKLSLTTGNSGKRIACGVIGYSMNN